MEIKPIVSWIAMESKSKICLKLLLLEPCYGLNCKPLHLQIGEESQQLITVGYICSVQAKQSRMLWESRRMVHPGHQEGQFPGRIVHMRWNRYLQRGEKRKTIMGSRERRFFCCCCYSRPTSGPHKSEEQWQGREGGRLEEKLVYFPYSSVS